jgi:hypothetical protein
LPDYFASWSKSGCEPCRGADNAFFTVAIIIFLLCPVPIHAFVAWIDASKQVSNAMFMSTLATQLVTHLQILSMVARFDVEWPEHVASALKVLSFIMFELRMFAPQCSMNSWGFEEEYTIQVLLPLMFTGLYGCYYVISRLVQKTLNVDIIVGVCGRIFLVFHVAILARCAEYWECYNHPDPLTDTSLVAYPNVLCWSQTHLSILPVTIMGLLMYCILCTGGVAWIVYQAPTRFAEKSFVRRYGFLMLKFRPDRWYWALPLLLRNTLLAFTMTFVPDRPVIQAILFCLFLLAFLCLNSAYQPWREPSYNTNELVGTALVLMFTLAALPLAPRDGKIENELTMFLLLSTICGGLFAIWVVGNALKETIQRARQVRLTQAKRENKLAHAQQVVPHPSDHSLEKEASLAEQTDVLSARSDNQLTKINTTLVSGLREVSKWLDQQSNETLSEIMDCMNIYDKKSVQGFVRLISSEYMQHNRLAGAASPLFASRVVYNKCEEDSAITPIPPARDPAPMIVPDGDTNEDLKAEEFH